MSDATCAIYCRISDDRTGLRAGVERQEAECRALAERHGWEVAEVFVDNDLSAFKRKPRPEYLRLLEAIRGRQFGALVAWHPDRIYRRNVELEDFIDAVNAAGVKVATVQAGLVDLTTPSGRLVARQLGAVAQYESEHKAERIRSKHREMAEQGKGSGGGTRPFGFEADRHTIREDEAARIREAVEHVRSGGTLVGLAKRWTAEGVPTVTGRPWRTPTLRRLLTSARIAGLREHHGQVTATAAWPAIVDREAWEEARSILGAPTPRHGTGAGVARKYLLTGFAYCALCGARLVARPRADKTRCYVCASGPNFNGCGKIRRIADPVEEEVRERVFALLDGPGLVEALHARAGDDPEARSLADALRGYEQRLEGLERDFVEGLYDGPEYRRLRGALLARMEGAQTALARRARRRAVEGLPSGGEGLRDWWGAADLGQRRALVGLVVERVVIHPAQRGLNKFDPLRIEVVWRV